MYAIRAARSFSGRKKIAMFEGGFHGAHDSVLVKADPGSPVNKPTYYTMGQGIPEETLSNTIMLPYMNEAAFDLIREYKNDLALVLIEPEQGSNPRLDQGPFLKQLAEVCRESDVLLLFDEVITGFRMAYGGAQEYFGVVPDLAIFGKAPGGGLPMGAITGRADVMHGFANQFDIYRDDGTSDPSIFSSGTFSGNPLTMAAGKAALTYLRDHQEVYTYMNEQGTRLADEVNEFFMKEELPGQMANAMSMFYLRVQRGPMVRAGRDIDMSLRQADEMVTLHMLKHGVVIPPVHLAYISAAHTPEDIDTIIAAIKESFREVRKDGML
jgi:glutamate-1-semialdehyde 2,1-aminomutase